MEEKQILSLLWQRSEEAIAALQSLYGHRLTGLARGILPTEADAQECVNDTYLALWNTIPPQRPQPLTPYVLRICKNIAISRLRQLTSAKRSSYELALDELDEAIGTDSLEQVLSARELGRAIDDFLDTLNPQDRILFLRRHWYGESVQDIARRMEMREGSVSVRLHRIRSKLKTYLTKEGFYE